ncbi:MAG TPA: L-threonylcarbamoyladenylate synthase [Opitutaceae bacterium]|jgi:L-threonylcarbamoyladenylate synthase
MASQARIHKPSPASLALLARVIRRGGLVAVPSETVYGLAADATSRAACLRIFRAKRRPLSDPLIVHIARPGDLSRVAVPNPAAVRLARKFWPGPLTLVLPRTSAIPREATAGMDSVAVRLPAHPLFRRLIRLAGVPLAAPSANPFGYVSPTTAEHVRRSLGSRVRHILDGGPSSVGLESTIVDLRDPSRPRLLRPGAVTRAELRRALGVPVAAARSSGNSARLAPGRLPSHYSPRTPLLLHRWLDPRQAARSPREAWVFLARPAARAARNVFWLDETGEPRRAARRLFAVLREVDEAAFERIHVERPSPAGIGEALLDRLARASARPTGGPRKAPKGSARSARRSRP